MFIFHQSSYFEMGASNIENNIRMIEHNWRAFFQNESSPFLRFLGKWEKLLILVNENFFLWIFSCMARWNILVSISVIINAQIAVLVRLICLREKKKTMNLTRFGKIIIIICRFLHLITSRNFADLVNNGMDH